MQKIGQNGYSDEEVLAVLRGLTGTRELSFRYDVLDSSHAFVRTLDNVVEGAVSYNALAEVKRTAKFKIVETATPVNYLSDRIKPYVRVTMPKKVGTYTTSVEAIPNSIARWKLDEVAVGTAADASGHGRTLTIPAGASVAQAGLTLDGGTSVSITTTQALTGVADYLNARSVIALTMWLRPNALGVGVMKTTNGAPTNGIVVDVAANGQITFSMALSTAQTVVAKSTVGAITAGATNFVAFTWQSGVGSRIFVNGQDRFDPVASTSPAAVGSLINCANLTIGQGSLGTNFSGRLDNVALFDLYMISDTAYDLYQAGLQVGRYGTLNYAEWPQGVFILSTPAKNIDAGSSVSRDVDAYDLLQTLAEDLMDQRYYVGGSANYVSAVTELLSAANYLPEGAWDVVASSAITPATGYEWDPGTSRLAIVNDLLTAINYQTLWFDENGRAQVQPYILPASRLSEFTYAADGQSVVFPDAEYTLDLYHIPNTWVVVRSDPDKPALRASYTNSDPASPTSTVSRGRTILDLRSEEDAADQFVLNDLVLRIAAEAMSVYDEVTLKTAIMPFHSDTDSYTLSYPDLGVTGKYNEIAWDMPLVAGGQMSHKARKTVTTV